MKIKRIITGIFVSLLLINAEAQLSPIVDSIPMSDGKKLAADIYKPSGMSSGPVILIQTPYNRQLFRFSLPLGIGLNLNSSNYIFVVTDWRGFYGSKNAGYFGSPNQGTDGYNTVEWIAAQSWSNGKIGTWGASALGKVQFQTAKTNPPHLTCINPLVAGPQFEYQEYFQEGALRTEYLQQLDQLGFGLSPFVMAHPYKDFTWVFTESANEYPDSIRVPTFMIGGWYDHNIRLMLNFYNELNTLSPLAVRDKHKLLMGPWEHGGKGNAKVGTSTQGQLSYPNAQNKNDSMSLEFFDFYLRNVGNVWDSEPKITYYQMGDNKWLQSEVWPPAGPIATDFYLHSDGSLNTNVPGSPRDSLRFSYDPQNPSPTIGGCTLRNDLNQGPYDQKPDVESRNDVLIFSTVVLSQSVVLRGNVIVKLKVGSDRMDTDFDVRLTDVYPDGRSMLLNDGVFRMRFRNGFASNNIVMMQKDTVYDCVIELPATCITFLAGHKIRLIVSSSNYPKYNRNMNNGDIMYPGNSMDSVFNPLVATNIVYTNSNNASKVTLPLVDYKVGIFNINKINRNIAFWPNPSTNRIQLDLSGFNEQIKLSIRDVEGRLISEMQTVNEVISLDISKLTSGVYTIEVKDDLGVSFIKFVRQ